MPCVNSDNINNILQGFTFFIIPRVRGEIILGVLPFFEICFLAGNNGEITFSIIPLNMSHRVSVLHPSVTAYAI